MAINNTVFLNSFGYALVRRQEATGQWFFVRMTGAIDTIVDAPGPGVWTYHLLIYQHPQYEGNDGNLARPLIEAVGRENAVIVMNQKR